VKVTINDRCTGQGRCFGYAPEIFDFDELGNGIVKGDGVVSDVELQSKARLAATNCPEGAIEIEEER
jgi:ferredoxin